MQINATATFTLKNQYVWSPYKSSLTACRVDPMKVSISTQTVAPKNVCTVSVFRVVNVGAFVSCVQNQSKDSRGYASLM